MIAPDAEPAFSLLIAVEPPVALDAATAGPVRLVQITGGTVSGGLTGRILPGGADWQTIGADGAIAIEARYLLELNDGAHIEVQTRGQRAAQASCFWSAIWLRTTAPAHHALNHRQFVGRGRKGEHGVAIDVFALPDL